MQTDVQSDSLYYDSRILISSKDYIVGGSCLADKVRPASVSLCKELTPISKIVDVNLEFVKRYKLSKFHMACNLDDDLIYVVILAYLANKDIKLKDRILNTYGISLNALSWMIYHGVHHSLYIHSIDFMNKADTSHLCTICNATRCVKLVTYGLHQFLETTGPGALTGNRVGHSNEDFESCHFVLWTCHHHNEFTKEELMSLHGVFGTNIYTHGLPQYGHAHIHIIKGEYFHTVRLRESLELAQKAVNKGRNFSSHDLFQPIDLYLHNCGNRGRLFYTALLCVLTFRLELPPVAKMIVDFYSIAYPNTFSDLYLR